MLSAYRHTNDNDTILQTVFMSNLYICELFFLLNWYLFSKYSWCPNISSFHGRKATQWVAIFMVNVMKFIESIICIFLTNPQ